MSDGNPSIGHFLLNSPLNPHTPPFEPSSSSYEHIQETDEQRFSNTENDSHIEPIENGENQHHDISRHSSMIQPVEPSLEQEQPTETHFIEETLESNQNQDEQFISSSQIEPVSNDNEEFSSSEEEEETNKLPIEESTINNDYETSIDETSIIEQSFPGHHDENNIPDQFKLVEKNYCLYTSAHFFANSSATSKKI